MESSLNTFPLKKKKKKSFPTQSPPPKNPREMPWNSKKEAGRHFDKGNGLESRELTLRLSGETGSWARHTCSPPFNYQVC